MGGAKLAIAPLEPHRIPNFLNLPIRQNDYTT
jgi:hypothetical protein